MGTELLSRLPRHHPCSISNALLVSTELLSRFEDTFSIQSASLFLYILSSSQGPVFLLCYLCNDPLSCSQGLQETFSALPLHCSFVSTELPSRLATLCLCLPCIILWVCTEQLSRLPRHLLCSICNTLHVCTELLSRLSRHLLCSTSNALLLSTELLSRLSRSLLSAACIALCVGTELQLR